MACRGGGGEWRSSSGSGVDPASLSIPPSLGLPLDPECSSVQRGPEVLQGVWGVQRGRAGSWLRGLQS